ncbi:MAG: EF-hand domain-containing protein [Porticoccaceae bacterium]
MKKHIKLSCLLFVPIVCTAESKEAWQAFDKNKDNALTIAEFANYKADQYADLDVSGDGKWSKSEFVKGLRDMKDMDPHWLREKFRRFDKDDNGILTIEEAEKEIAVNFKWLDKDKSKTITKKEMPKKF